MIGFQHRLILYSSPLLHQFLFQIASYWVVRSCKSKILSLAFGLEAKITPERDPFMIASCSQLLIEFHRTLAKCCF